MLSLSFNGRTVNLTADAEGRFNLNAIFKTSGAKRSLIPSEWTRNAQVVELIAKFSKPEIPGLVKVRGGNKPGTWAIKELVFAYAEWISPEFHKAVLDSFTAAVEGDGDKSVRKARTVARIEGIQMRKDFASRIARACGAKSIGSISHENNQIILGKTSDEFREENGLKKSSSIRDYMDDKTLNKYKLAEALQVCLIDAEESKGAVAILLNGLVERTKQVISSLPSN